MRDRGVEIGKCRSVPLEAASLAACLANNAFQLSVRAREMPMFVFQDLLFAAIGVTLSLCSMRPAIEKPECGSSPIDIALTDVSEHKQWIVRHGFCHRCSSVRHLAPVRTEKQLVDDLKARSKVLQSAGSGDCMATAASMLCYLIGVKVDFFCHIGVFFLKDRAQKERY